ERSRRARRRGSPLREERGAVPAALSDHEDEPRVGVVPAAQQPAEPPGGQRRPRRRARPVEELRAVRHRRNRADELQAERLEAADAAGERQASPERRGVLVGAPGAPLLAVEVLAPQDRIGEAEGTADRRAELPPDAVEEAGGGFIEAEQEESRRRDVARDPF